jgi:hypothetical protein
MGRVVCVVFLLALTALSGCGEGADDSVSGSGGPAGGSPPATVHGPESQPSDKQAQAWRARGRQACRGLEPVEAARRFEAAARRAGAHERFIGLVTEPTPAVEHTPGYPRLVAAFYATTRPGPQRTLAAAGCAEELAAHD